MAAITTDKALVNNTNWSVIKVLVNLGKRFRNETFWDIVFIDVCDLRQAIALPPREIKDYIRNGNYGITTFDSPPLLLTPIHNIDHFI